MGSEEGNWAMGNRGDTGDTGKHRNALCGLAWGNLCDEEKNYPLLSQAIHPGLTLYPNTHTPPQTKAFTPPQRTHNTPCWSNLKSSVPCSSSRDSFPCTCTRGRRGRSLVCFDSVGASQMHPPKSWINGNEPLSPSPFPISSSDSPSHPHPQTHHRASQVEARRA